jgi:hypothetical protein
MTDKGRMSVEQCIKTVFFFTETRSVVVTQRRFPDHFTCGQNWPLNSPDLNSHDYFLWGFLNKITFPKKPQTLKELRALIIQACNEITVDMCRRVINIITINVEETARHNGDHTEHLIHRG